MKEIGFSNFQGIEQEKDDDCAPTSITNVLSNLNEHIDRDQFDIFIRHNLKREDSMFKEISDVFNRYNQNYDCIYKHCKGSVNKLIKYIKKSLKKKIPVLIAIKSLYNPRCAHIVPVIRYNNSELVYFDPDPNHYGEYKFNYKTNELKSNLIPGKFDTLILTER